MVVLSAHHDFPSNRPSSASIAVLKTGLLSSYHSTDTQREPQPERARCIIIWEEAIFGGCPEAIEKIKMANGGDDANLYIVN